MIRRDVVLVGGGHTHALLLRKLAKAPLPNARVTLVTEALQTPYSGMVPAWLAGHCSLTDIHIDLARLCHAAKVRLIQARVTGVLPAAKKLQLAEQADLCYDLLSLNTGGASALASYSAEDHGVPIKPISRLTTLWQSLTEQNSHLGGQHWAIIGGGAGAVEVVLALAYRWRTVAANRLSLVFAGESILPTYRPATRRRVEQQLRTAGVALVPNFRVSTASPDRLIAASGQSLAVDQSLWCTPVAAPAWPAHAGLAVDSQGFIAVNEFLQSTSHEDIFAVGDVAALTASPRPKAGVYAVRSAPFLEKNLRACLSGKRLTAVKLQRSYLSLLALGDKTAVGQRGPLSLSGPWVWRWKQRIDQAFMRQLSPALPLMSTSADTAPRCTGCGSKIGPAVLAETLVAAGLSSSAEDAAQLADLGENSWWQSVDGLRCFSDDLYRFGEISVHHAVNDCYAMGIQPVNAQLWLNLAFAPPHLIARDAQQLMAGALAALKHHQLQLIGGHSSEGAETHLAVVVNGQGAARWRKQSIAAGDWLLLNRPLGSGILLAAEMQGRASAMALTGLWQHLRCSNRAFYQRLQGMTVHAATDISGFGLIGHLLEMLEQQPFTITVDAKAVPLLPEVYRLAKQGVESTLAAQLAPLLRKCEIQQPDQSLVKILLDPQTQGGLLISVPASAGKTLVANQQATKIAEVSAATKPTIVIR